MITQSRGFTLVEVLVYLSILLIVSVGGILLILSLDDVIQEYKIETALYRSATNVLEQVAVEIREGESLDLGNSVIAIAGAGKLTIENGGVDTTFEQVGNELLLSVDGVQQGNLLSEPVTVSDFTVYSYQNAVGTMVRVKLRLSATIGSTTKTMTFYDGAVIRGDI